MIPCVGCVTVKSTASFEVKTCCYVDTQRGYLPHRNGVRSSDCPNSDTVQAERGLGLLTDGRPGDVCCFSLIMEMIMAV